MQQGTPSSGGVRSTTPIELVSRTAENAGLHGEHRRQPAKLRRRDRPRGRRCPARFRRRRGRVFALKGRASGRRGTDDTVGTRRHGAEQRASSRAHDRGPASGHGFRSADRFRDRHGRELGAARCGDRAPGATLFKNGFQVCDATPCEVTADRTRRSRSKRARALKRVWPRCWLNVTRRSRSSSPAAVAARGPQRARSGCARSRSTGSRSCDLASSQRTRAV